MTTRTYYVAKTAEGADIPAQARKLGTAKYGYRTIVQALRNTPPNGYVQERHCDGSDDWAGRIVVGQANLLV